jgi:putative transposase
MKDLFSMAGITKQGLWKHHRCQERKRELVEHTLRQIRKIRGRHKHMGCRAIYSALTEKPLVGRDRFIEIGLDYGFRLKRKRNKRKTTWSQQVEIFPNSLEGKELTGINQAWQSDIFYCEDQGKGYYGITIIDVYSRRLLALHLSQSLRAEENVMALKKAIRNRSKHNLLHCIFHSDRGSQYISEKQKALLDHYGMDKSMGKLPQENAYAERIQETIKNCYLCDENLATNDLNIISSRIMRKYNHERPHSSLGMMTPVAFEKYVENLPKKRRPKELIYKWDHSLSTNSKLLTKRKK